MADLAESARRKARVRTGALSPLALEAVRRIATLFEPLDAYLNRDPVEDPPDIFPGLMSGMRVSNEQTGIPFRHASSGMHYNATLLAERGFKGPPTSIEICNTAPTASPTRPPSLPASPTQA